MVKTFFSTRTQMPLAPKRLDLSRAGCSDRIVGRESNAETRFAHLDALWAEPAGVRRPGH